MVQRDDFFDAPCALLNPIKVIQSKCHTEHAILEIMRRSCFERHCRFLEWLLEFHYRLVLLRKRIRVLRTREQIVFVAEHRAFRGLDSEQCRIQPAEQSVLLDRLLQVRHLHAF
jgi:hypothetical protein